MLSVRTVGVFIDFIVAVDVAERLVGVAGRADVEMDW